MKVPKLTVKMPPKNENIILAADFNGRIGNQPIPECIGTYGEQVTNHNGAALRDFVLLIRTQTDYQNKNYNINQKYEGT